VTRREIEDAVDGVQPQRIEMELGKPVQRVVDDEAADGVAAATVVVDRWSPRRAVGIGEVGTELGEVVSFRSEMVVDDVEHGSESAPVTSVDEPLKPRGAAVAGLRREERHAVVAPVAVAGKLGHRHQLDRGDAEVA
jgi:hypothetical protein